MKHNALILSILLVLGMGNVVYAQPSGPEQNSTSPTQQQIIQQLSEEKYKVYQEWDNKIDERFKSNISPYIYTLDKTVDALKFFGGLLFAMVGTALVLNHGRLRTEVEKAVKLAVEKSVEEEVNKTKTEIYGELRSELKKSVSIIDKLIYLEHAKRQLLLVVQDIEAPSIRHIPSKQAKDEINHFLTEINNFKKELKKLAEGKKEFEDIGDTNYNQEIVANAYRYLGGKDELGHYKDAIGLFEKILDKEKNNKEFNKNNLFIWMGNCYAGTGDYPEAVKQYNKVDDKSDDKCGIQVCISKGDSFKTMLKFDDAITEFGIARQNQENYKDRYYYWESLYGEACSLVDKGDDRDIAAAKVLYKQFFNDDDAIEIKQNTFIEPVWINVSIGDCYRKMGGVNNYNTSKDHYLRALELSRKNKIGVDVVHYKLGRLYIDLKEYKDASYEFMSDCKEYKMDDYNLLLLFWGYSLIANDKESEGKLKINDAITALEVEVDKKEKERNSKPNPDEYKYLICYPYYNLAIGFAMQDGGTEKAIYYLGRLIRDFEFDFIKKRATASDCSDFVKIKDNDEFKKLVGL